MRGLNLRSFLAVLIVGFLWMPGASNAAAGSEGKSKAFIRGFYGLSSIKAGDINDNITLLNVAVSPAIPKMSSRTIYGGSFGYFINPKFDIQATYIQETYKGVGDITSPSTVKEVGYVFTQGVIAATVDYYPVHMERVQIYIGAGPAFMSSPKLTYKTTAGLTADLTPESKVGGLGRAGIATLIGGHFNLFAEGQYQYLISGDVKFSDGSFLTNGTTQKKAVVDASGANFMAGIGWSF